MTTDEALAPKASSRTVILLISSFSSGGTVTPGANAAKKLS